jgi:hypothetical protein
MSYENLRKQITEKRLGKSKIEQNNIEEDEHGIDEKWQKIKRLIDKTEPRLYKFMFKETHDASIDARNNLNEIRKLCVELRDSILKQRQDNESKY